MMQQEPTEQFSIGASVMLRPPPQGPKWSALRFAASLLKAVAWITAFIGFLAALGSIIGSFLPLPFLKSTLVIGMFGFNSIIAGLITAVIILAATGLVFLALFVYSELMLLLVAVERNTRALSMTWWPDESQSASGSLRLRR